MLFLSVMFINVLAWWLLKWVTGTVSEARAYKKMLLESIKGKAPSEINFPHWIHSIDGVTRIIPVDCHQRPGLKIIDGKVQGLF